MPNTIELEGRSAKGPASHAGHPVTLVNSFVVDPGRDEAFMALWTEASRYFRSQPGFVSLRFHRALSPDADYRYVNVACWATLEDFQAAHATDEFRRVVGQDAWREFPSNPALYEVVAAADADSTVRSTSASV
jgi:heme-degrading monooxygenase HmoA